MVVLKVWQKRSYL